MYTIPCSAEVNREQPVPVILISGRHDAEAAAVASAYVVRILVKPLKPPDLRSAVEALTAECVAGRRLVEACMPVVKQHNPHQGVARRTVVEAISPRASPSC
jgi:hypothetical protein